jgi:hypothetical protein
LNDGSTRPDLHLATRVWLTFALAADGDRDLGRDSFKLLLWTSAADRVRCLSADAAKLPGACDAGM